MIRGELTRVMQGSRGPFSCSESSFLGCPGVPGASLGSQTVKRLPTMRETWVPSLVGKTPWRRKWPPTPGFLPGEFQGQRSLVLQSTGSQRVGHNRAASLPDGPVVKNPSCNAKDTGSIPGPRRSHTSQGGRAHVPQ